MEVQQKLLSVKSGKQPGTDKIRGEIYKWMASSEVCTEKIRMAMNKVMEEGIVPEGWKISKTVMIPKTKKILRSLNLKIIDFIALTNVGYQIFMSLVKDQIMEHIRQADEQSEFQSGFTGGRRLEDKLDNLFILRYCIEGSYKRGKPLFVIAIDFAKAFDSVNRVVLMWHRCDPYLLQVVTELYTNIHKYYTVIHKYLCSYTQIFKGELRIGQMEASNGIRQGCTGSPQLFVMIVNMIIREILEHSGI